MDIGSTVKVIEVDSDTLAQAFFDDFDNGDEIKAQEAYIGMVGVVEEFMVGVGMSDRAVQVRFADDTSVVVMPWDLQEVNDEISPLTDLPKTRVPPYQGLSADEQDLLDRLLISMVSNDAGRTPLALVDRAVEIVLERTKALSMTYERD